MPNIAEKQKITLNAGNIGLPASRVADELPPEQIAAKNAKFIRPWDRAWAGCGTAGGAWQHAWPRANIPYTVAYRNQIAIRKLYLRALFSSNMQPLKHPCAVKQDMILIFKSI
ncbi:PAS/PAC sensor protein [Operophtera brumata]|uniref:PAS/PAC sensor protein n=1 Tax=Operophtera brumata TaxID=104452 RepID=A0A0L7LBF5_OPEBR|nr:PAS/PAC sensor protein [Operophtera brumata]